MNAVSLHGNSWLFSLDDGIDIFFQCDILCDRRNGKPMEMEGYYLYHALRYYSAREEIDISKDQQMIVDAVLKRLKSQDNFWYHSHFSSNPSESHMRFTSCAIRLLVDAYLNKNAQIQSELLKKVLHKHLSYNERMEDDIIWFLHDSLEQESEYYQDRKNVNQVWGSTKGNMLIFNTHLDTLNTLLYTLKSNVLPEESENECTKYMEGAIMSLNMVLNEANNVKSYPFQLLDSVIRSVGFKFHKKKALISQLIDRLFVAYYWRIRIRLKAVFPTFFFSDGYTERDINLPGLSFGYHVVNLWDLAKLVRLLETNNQLHLVLKIRLFKVLKKGIKYALRTDFRNTIERMMGSQTMIYTQLCEAIGIVILQYNLLNRMWIDMYMQARKGIIPTSGMLGFDPLISDIISDKRLNELKESHLISSQIDLFNDSSRGLLIINTTDYPIPLRESLLQQVENDEFLKGSSLLPKSAVVLVPNLKIGST